MFVETVSLFSQGYPEIYYAVQAIFELPGAFILDFQVLGLYESHAQLQTIGCPGDYCVILRYLAVSLS